MLMTEMAIGKFGCGRKSVLCIAFRIDVRCICFVVATVNVIVVPLDVFVFPALGQ
jgi:hypothetical protein